jgi:predicted  nucleic acid-binding Zn-ribbon protein
MVVKASKTVDKNTSTLRAIKELVEIIKKKLDWMELRTSSTSSAVQRIQEQQSVMNDKLDQHTKTLKSHTLTLAGHTKIHTKHTSILEKHTGQLGALLLDVDQLQQESKALGDEIVENRKTRKEVKKIKQRLGLAS